MRLITILFVHLWLHTLSAGWLTDLNEARQLAVKDHRLILLNFSGSDWCGPCIQLHDRVFESLPFHQLADSSLVLVNADFPRMKKHQLPAHQQQLNNEMADHYNPKGKFPYTLLLDADGKILKEWEGYPGTTPEQFCYQVKAVIDGKK